jgi:hypothetical protein
MSPFSLTERYTTYLCFGFRLVMWSFRVPNTFTDEIINYFEL